MPIEFRFSTGDKAIADELAAKYGGEVLELDGPIGGYEVVAGDISDLLSGDDAAGDVA